MTEQDWRKPGRDFHAPGRSALICENAAAATSHPLASLTAIEILREGGNAVDAAIAASAVLAVVEPHMTGIGGDCFALIAPKGSDRIIAYNGAGRTAKTAAPEWFLERGYRSIEPDDVHAVTVPGAIEAWCRLSEDHGRLGIGRLLQPAIAYAEDGYFVAPRIAADWQRAVDKLKRDPDAARHLLRNGAAPAVGDRMAMPALARTLREIAQRGPNGFYEGWVADDIVTKLSTEGSHITRDDLAAHRGSYVDPIKTQYRGLEVWECPPPGQGLTALIMLNILSSLPDIGSSPLSLDRLHLQTEASKLAFRERDRHIADPAHASVPVDRLLSAAHTKQLAERIDPDKAQMLRSEPPMHPDTIYLTVVDSERTAVSFINSIYYSFGSGRLAPKSGVLLQNRGACFRVDPTHPNCIGPVKQPMHTIIPALATKDGRPEISFAVMGGDYQPVGQAHVLGNMLDFGLDPQAALDCPRLFHGEGVIAAEAGIPEAILRGLEAKGHTVERSPEPLGGGQIIAIDWQRGCLISGSDSRKDGCALGY